MRLVIDSLVALMLAGLLGGILLYQRSTEEESRDVELLRQSLRRIEQQIAYHSAVADTQLTGRGFPETIDPEWFAADLPRNVLANGPHPWLEVATAEQANLQHPPVRVMLDKSYAGFWYNPYQGVVRARVPSEVSDEQAIAIYNEVNGSYEKDLIDHTGLRLISGTD